MITKLDRSGSVEKLGILLDEMAQHAEVQSILVLACDANGYTPEAVDAILRRVSVPLFGGIFPEIIYEKEKLSQGLIVAGIADRAEVQVIPRLSDVQADYSAMIDDSRTSGDTKTMIVFVDGLARRISALVEALFNVFGLQFNYVGGGAGSLSFQQKPCVLTNAGLVQDSAVLATLPTASGVGVSHGWTDIAGPFEVTESDRNVIQTLDWKPAFEVYRSVVENHARKPLTAGNFFEIAKSYPFGIIKLGTEKIVRDPLMVQDENSLVCVGEVPQGVHVHILTGDVHSLVCAAGRALLLGQQCFSALPQCRTTLFIDCISRTLFLEEQFNRELEAVYQESVSLIGALTLGEIANSRRDYLEFYNKTSVVGVLEG
ncbi:MAG: FIST C-terminal domain-containing protein [Phycisphaerae bacterium]|nr:FIST C-terminal domain-containing protein [Phycisphaerae bacterium]